MHKKRLFSLLYVITVCFSWHSYAAHQESVKEFPHMPLRTTQEMVWWDDWHMIPDATTNPLCFRTYPFDTIATSGFYKLATNVTNQITISVSNVTLDMNGCTVSGGTNGIVINSGLSNVTINNGTVTNVTTDGIQINNGCNDIVLSNITVKNCLRGISGTQVSNALIKNCDFILNTTGLHLDTARNVVVDHCIASANTQAGYSLVATTTCTITDCTAVATGDGNTNASGNQANIFGFVASNGYGNVFERCIASSTQGLAATDTNDVIAGFALRGTEGSSKIIECEAANSTTSPSGVAIPTGILLESRFDSLTTVTSDVLQAPGFQGTLYTAWSPDGNYLAAAISVFSNPSTLVIYKFDRTIPRLIQVDGILVSLASLSLHLSWSPSGEYLAFGGGFSGVNDLVIYRFDRADERLRQIISVAPEGDTGVIVQAVAWSPSSKYLAIGLIQVTTAVNTLFVYRFNSVAQTLTQVVATSPDNALPGNGTVNSVAWSPDGQYLAVGGNFNGDTTFALFIYQFNESKETLTQVDSQDPDGAGAGSTVVTLNWSPDGKYLVVAGSFQGFTGNCLMLYRFSRTTKTLTLVDSINPDGGDLLDTVRDSDWSSDGNYLVIGGTINGNTNNDVLVYKLSRTTETLTQVAATNPGGTGTSDLILATQWSPDGNYLAVGGLLDTVISANSLIIYTGIQFPRNNVITNNKVYGNSGGSWPWGAGISGSSISNLIIDNVAYSNPINPPVISSNYQFVANVFNPLFGDAPTTLQNIENNLKQVIPDRYDIPAAINGLELLAQSLVDKLV